MDWFSQLSESASNLYSSTVSAGTDYLNTRINDYTTDPKPVNTVNPVAATPVQTSGAGMFGYNWQTIAAIATVVGVLFMILRGK